MQQWVKPLNPAKVLLGNNNNYSSVAEGFEKILIYLFTVKRSKGESNKCTSKSSSPFLKLFKALVSHAGLGVSSLNQKGFGESNSKCFRDEEISLLLAVEETNASIL